jgi:hypothetical protein
MLSASLSLSVVSRPFRNQARDYLPLTGEPLFAFRDVPVGFREIFFFRGSIERRMVSRMAAPRPPQAAHQPWRQRRP